MAISIEDVEHVAKLARLALSDREKETFRSQLSDVLDHAKVISEVDTDNVKPTSHTVQIDNVLREDRCTPSLSVEEATANAPWADSGGFKVPRII